MAVKGLRDRRHPHQPDRHLDRDQVVPAARAFGGQGKQFLHRERFLFQARPRGDAASGHLPGCHGLLEDDERLRIARCRAGRSPGWARSGLCSRTRSSRSRRSCSRLRPVCQGT